jgi:hypothetical protein
MEFSFKVDWVIEEAEHISENDDVTVQATVTATALETGWYAADAELVVHCEDLTILDSEESDITSDDHKARIGLQNTAGDPKSPEFTQDSYKDLPPVSDDFEPKGEKRYGLPDFKSTDDSKTISFVLKTGSRLRDTPPAVEGNYTIPCFVEFTAKELEPASHPGEPAAVDPLSFKVQD